ncbi:metal-dependent hydrolase family protein [Ulvibacter antarcticus]|uniref:Imidazolonepropionase-like amidohydrolase n=1 Tax=Ulvibacter antarcticus TaxID=442714 RepID=A0A3L9ZDE2_9FLAO|nr:amidohydrolase family protein [Ulvibacter antarcticus]RMA64672.1 imidazolonepropionase-like amidohydrolase [Ulvibacter antarcticus]
MPKFQLLLIVLSINLIVFSTKAQTTVIHAGTVLTIPGDKPKKNQSIIIKDGKIKEVRNGFLMATELGLASEEIELIDLKNSFVMPGFIDLHTHITGERDPNKNPHEWVTLENEDYAFNAIPYATRTLQAGFTTVRNLGGDAKLMNALKRAIAKGLIEGPRIIAATGAISATGGHGDFHGYRKDILELDGKGVGICDGSDDCRRAVRALVKQGADVIKITATGGVLSNTAAGVGQQLSNDELEAIVSTAASLGRKVAAHAHDAEGVNAALRAGVNSIEHGSYLNDESIRLFKETGAYLVPTLLAGVSVTEELDVNENIPPAIADKIRQVGPVVEASFKKALAAKINIAFGTDSGVSKHGDNAREFELMVKYGMDPNEAIKTATINASKLLGMENQLGTIEAGKSADIVAVIGNPLEQISILKEVSFVMKEGVVYKE